MPFPARLIATDLDGTLWGRGLTMHPATVEALAELERRGVGVLAATGRRPTSALEGFEANELLLPAVLLDGTLGEDFPTGTRFHEAFFPAAATAQVLDLFLDDDLQPCVYVDHPELELLIGPRPSTADSHLAAVRSYATEAVLDAEVPGHDVLAFTIIGIDRARVAPLSDRINATGLAEATLVTDSHYGGTSLSVIPQAVTKWTGVAAYCAANDIPTEAVLAVGDAQNDLGMLAGAGHAVVPRTADAEVLAVADSIIDGPDDGGWAAILGLIE